MLGVEIEKHIRRRIADAAVVSAPWPHIVIKDILPDDLFSKARDAAERTGYIYPIDNGNGEALFPESPARPHPDMPEDVKAFWSVMQGEVCPAINRLIAEKFRDQIAAHINWMQRMGLLSETPALQDSALQVFARRDSRVPPHHHALFEATSCLLYLSDDRLGTTLNAYRAHFFPFFDRVIVNGTRQHHKALFFTYNTHIEAREAKTIPGEPNTLVAMLNTPWSAHSMTEKHREVRRILLFGALYSRHAFRSQYRDWPGFILYPDGSATGP